MQKFIHSQPSMMRILLITTGMLLIYSFDIRGQINQGKVLAYDSYGNSIEVQDANGNLTKYYYGNNDSAFAQATMNGARGVYLTGIQKVKGSADAISAGVRPTGSGVDDLFTEARYDDLGRLVEIIDENEQTIRFGYDKFGRLINEWNANEVLTTSYSYFYSVTANNGAFSPLDPNFVENISFSEGFTSDGLIGYWKFEDNVQDNSGNGLHGTFQGSANANKRGFIGYGLSLPGTNSSYVSLGNNSSFRSDWITIMGWIKPEASSNQTQIVTQENYGYRFSYQSNGIRLLIKLNDSDQANQYGEVSYGVSNSINVDEWNHVAVTFGTDRKIRVYVNGKLEGTSQQYTGGGGKITYTGTASTTVGRGTSATWRNPFIGIIDELKMYNHALSIDEILADYQSSTHVTYLDGLGREIQTQQRGGGNTLITGIRYNERGLQDVVSRPIEGSQTTFATNLFEGTSGSFDPESSTGLGNNSPVEAYYDNLSLGADADFAYSYTKYEASPLARSVLQTLPGDDHRYGQGNETTTTYGLNSTTGETFAINGKSWGLNILQKTITRDPDGKETITYTDGWGRTIVSGVNWNPNPNGDEKLNKSSDDLVTYFEYDHLGNLVRVEDPRGLVTTYTYNRLGRLIEKELPDQAHPNKYCYDDKGRLRFHLDPNKYDNPHNLYQNTYYNYNYSKYDEFDRVVETGITDGFSTSYAQSLFEVGCGVSYVNDQSVPSSHNKPKSHYYYDDGTNAKSGARNLKGKLTKVSYFDSFGYMGSSVMGHTYYSYNELGLVEWIVQDIEGLNGDYFIRYTYDELGRIEKVYFDSPNAGEDFYFWYDYDALGRLQYIRSDDTGDKPTAQIEAEYIYYADGQVKQLILGDGVQTVDYTYTVQGWVKTMNEIGAHGSSMGEDKFGFHMDYHLNGNIEQQVWKQPGENNNLRFYVYEYDPASRLKEADFTGSDYSTGAFDVTYNYDRNGNIDEIFRNGNTSGNDRHFELFYEPNTNRLNYLKENGSSKNVDLDASGNTTMHALQSITNATYDWRNLPTEIETNTGTIRYSYDADGNRVKKAVAGGPVMYYIRGADGEVIAVHDGTQLLYWNLPGGIGRIDNY